MSLSLNLVILLYLIASVCFIQALKGLSHPTTSRLGNTFGMVGMGIAAFTTVALIYKLAPQITGLGLAWILLGLVVGGTVGTLLAHRVPMTRVDHDQNQLGFLGFGGQTGIAGTKVSRLGIRTFGRLCASMTSAS